MLKKAEISELGMVTCPICGYGQEAEPGTIICPNGSGHKFEAVAKKKTST